MPVTNAGFYNTKLKLLKDNSNNLFIFVYRTLFVFFLLLSFSDFNCRTCMHAVLSNGNGVIVIDRNRFQRRGATEAFRAAQRADHPQPPALLPVRLFSWTRWLVWGNQSVGGEVCRPLPLTCTQSRCWNCTLELVYVAKMVSLKFAGNFYFIR